MPSLRSRRTCNRIHHNENKMSSERGTRSTTSPIMTPVHHKSKLAFAVGSPRDVTSFPSSMDIPGHHFMSPNTSRNSTAAHVVKVIIRPNSIDKYPHRHNNLPNPRTSRSDLRQFSKNENANASEEKRQRRILDRIERLTNAEKQRVDELWKLHASGKRKGLRSPATSNDLPPKDHKSVRSDPYLTTPPTAGLPHQVPFPGIHQPRNKEKDEKAKSSRRTAAGWNDQFPPPPSRRASTGVLGRSRRTARQISTNRVR